MRLLKTYLCFALLFCSVLAIAQEEQSMKQIQFPTSEIEFESTIFNYGTIESGEIVQTVFTFTNTGSEPIVITNAKGSCGCTVPEWPKEPIAAGETGQFVVRFDSKNKVGAQSKRVTIYANTDPEISYLTIKGEVIKSLEKVKETVIEEPVERVRDIKAHDVTLYPNPTSETLHVSLANLEDKSADVFIYNLSGKLIDSQHVDQANLGDISFDVSDYASGLYTVSIKADNMHRIAKQVSIITE